ncbi:NCS2 family permease [Plastoroseomonas hellenica]|uniref:NCS2 family permease n=1 Tax=Plastoroseomonas hellenica TaxID=2687306 RepID=UPI001BA59ECE|nr:NCS2 family permease [Plastoroseomonas hellenica]MBR0645817.1 NCS2 family permease [Plastoroseomonas hellenica]
MERFFDMAARGTTPRTEVLAGFSTFLTMAYIIVVNPSIMAMAGIDQGAAFVATCLAAAIGCLLMGLIANFPIALAPGMGLNAYFAFAVVQGAGVPWQVALGAVFISGLLFFAVSVLRAREWLVNGIPFSLKLGIAAGIGFFLGLIGLKTMGIVVAHPATLVALGPLTAPSTLLACAGFLLIAGLSARGVPGAIVIGILATAAAGIPLGLTTWRGLIDLPPSLAPTFLQLDIAGALGLGIAGIVFTFFLVDLLDNTGTLIGTTHRAGLMRPDGTVPNLGRALMADSGGAMMGAVLGTSTTVSYIESAAGIQAGGRTGLTAVTVGLLFLVALFLAPLATAIPGFATAPALVFVACLMAQGLRDLRWDDATDFMPAIVTALAMPFTFSIATGIGLGFITFAGVKTIAGRAGEVHGAVWLIAALSAIKFALI